MTCVYEEIGCLRIKRSAVDQDIQEVWGSSDTDAWKDCFVKHPYTNFLKHGLLQQFTERDS